jgi:DNA-binding LacI/PurR family transcriptional regulator
MNKTKKPTIKDVALKAGISPSTVSNYLNKTALVNSDTGKRIENAIKKLSYVPHGAAKSLRTGKSKIIAIVLPEISDPFYYKLVEGLEEVAYHRGYSTIISSNQYDNKKERKQITSLLNNYIAGFIFATGGGDEKELDEVSKYGIPFVLVDRMAERDDVYSVEEDNYRSFYRATGYLIKKGHKDIYYITEPLVMETLKERLRAFKDALSANNIAFADRRIIIDDGLQLEKAKHGYEIMTRILKKNKPGAVFAPSDSIVFGAMNAAIERGFKIPEDISFMGNGNSTFAQFSNPPLTTIKQNKKKMGTTGMEMLIDMIENKAVPSRKVILDTEIIERASVRDLNIE